MASLRVRKPKTSGAERNTDQLCDEYSGYGTLRCSNKSSGCPGTKDNECLPKEMWSGTSASGGYYDYYLNNGIFKAGSLYTIAYARTVRCVPDLRHKKTDVKTPAF